MSDIVSPLEVRWKDWLAFTKHREPYASWASLALTIAISGTSGYLIYENGPRGWVFPVWCIAVVLCVFLVFHYCRILRKTVRLITESLEDEINRRAAVPKPASSETSANTR
jgi:hypothetical protein